MKDINFEKKFGGKLRTTIKINVATLRTLNKIGRGGESWEDIIIRLAEKWGKGYDDN